MRCVAIGVTLMLVLAGCTASSTMDAPPAGGAAAGLARADVRNTIGQTKAEATATQVGDSVRIRLAASGMPMGTYGAHVHTTGLCNAPDFASAGPHWNPTGRQHGKNNPNGQHHGDLPNLVIGSDGRGSLEMTIPAASLTGGGGPAMLDADGAALVIHAQADDYRTDPSGNSGARIACGVFR